MQQKSQEFHPEEHGGIPEDPRDAYEEALAWAERNAGREEQMLVSRRMDASKEPRNLNMDGSRKKPEEDMENPHGKIFLDER